MGAAAGTARRAIHWHTGKRLGVYRPRRPRSSPLYRLIEDHFEQFATVYDERFARRWGYWRPVVARVVEKYLACGILEHGFARVRCGSCKHEFLLAFSCKCRYFCPTCHAKRLALWGIWLEESLLAEVPHRQVVLAVPKRLRPYFLYHRSSQTLEVQRYDCLNLEPRCHTRAINARGIVGVPGCTIQRCDITVHPGFGSKFGPLCTFDSTGGRHNARPSGCTAPIPVRHTWDGWIQIPIVIPHPGLSIPDRTYWIFIASK